ncbi:major facilitator superfamily domain-containing protein [Pterulicium gracile]|uniref:Major facilitator superfamily domain-containing protein n=1 Tax=Pterulicium gracile TaxID=1884261 RepID=A0A5C3R0P1_9AGAR|nr:major facilitator superfamily domain-containing protein [Pterula gracilis]
MGSRSASCGCCFDFASCPRLTQRTDFRRKVDLHLLPPLAFVYAFALIDRSNLGIARLVGMDEDLGITIGDRFSILSMLFFIPYTLFQIPSNLLIRHVGPRLWISTCVLGWGVAQLSMGFASAWGHVAVCRVFLGVFEAGYFPAMTYVITTWYKRNEIQRRLGAFYLTSLLAAGFGSILGYGINGLDGKGGLAGWRWIFILEGATTIFLGLVTCVVVPVFPDQNRFLEPEETKYILQRVDEDRGDATPDKMTAAVFREHITDPLLWIYGLMYMCATMAFSAVGYFTTLLLNGMGFNVTESLLLSAPPFAFTAISMYFFSWISDITKRRAVFIGAQATLSTVGLFITMFGQVPAVRYLGIYLTTAGSAGCVPAILAYSANNVVSQTKRSVSTGLIISFGGSGGIFATMVFRQQDYPNYRPGMWAAAGCQLLMLCLLCLTTFILRRRNLRCQQGLLRKPLEGQPGFFYTL